MNLAFQLALISGMFVVSAFLMSVTVTILVDVWLRIRMKGL